MDEPSIYDIKKKNNFIGLSGDMVSCENGLNIFYNVKKSHDVIGKKSNTMVVFSPIIPCS